MYTYREMYMERIIPYPVKSLLHFYFKIETKLEAPCPSIVRWEAGGKDSGSNPRYRPA